MQMFGVYVCISTICRTLKTMGCTRQAMHRIAIQRSDEERAKFMANVSLYDVSMLVWLDESGCDDRNYRRKYGYSMRGIPPCDHRLLVRGTRYSAIPVVSAEGVHDVYITQGNMNGERFAKFVQECVLPILMPFNGSNPRSVVIMDNASIHLCPNSVLHLSEYFAVTFLQLMNYLFNFIILGRSVILFLLPFLTSLCIMTINRYWPLTT